MNQSPTKILHRHLHKQPLTAVGGKGVYLFDNTGTAYIDASGGAAVSCLGHGHPDVQAAIHKQVDELAFAHTGFFTSEPAEQLAAHLIEHTPTNADLSHVYFVSGGSEAMEAALKMARQYFVEIGQPQRRRFIARRQSYHGNTLGALAIGGNLWRRARFEPLLMDTSHVSPCYAYRDQRADESEQQYGLRLAQELETTILKEGADSIIAFVVETIGGATAGVITPVQGYLRAIREVCDRHGILLILDEVMCGMGRSGTLHAWEREGVRPDIQAIAKGLGGGYQPIGAVLAGRHVVEAMSKGSGFFQHGHTYMGHPIACAAALAVQKVLARDNLIEQVLARGNYLINQLRRRFSEHPYVGDIRGRGLFVGIELVADRERKTPFPSEMAVAGRLKSEAMVRGLICYPGSGTIDGNLGDHVTLAPPFVISESELDMVIDRLEDAINAAT